MITASIKITLLDNQPLYLQGMADFLRLQSLVKSVVTSTNYDELHRELQIDRPDIIFLELNFNTSRYDGFSICREIKQQYKNVFVVILSRYNAPHFVQFARECGAGAYFDKHTGSDAITEFLYLFAKGRTDNYYVKISPYEKFENHFQQEGFELRYLLTKMQCRVMKLIVAGNEHKEIEDTLHISYDTYRSHHNSILDKLHVKNDVELTKFALRHQLTEMDCEQLPSYIFKPDTPSKISP